MAVSDVLTREQRQLELRSILDECYAEAEAIAGGGTESALSQLGPLLQSIQELGSVRHAAAGVVLTLAAYKAAYPTQDITAHKAEFAGGFSARGYDTAITVPFLIEKNLPRSVESHWLTQAFSFVNELRPGATIKTQPKRLGPLTVEIASAVQTNGTPEFARAVVTALLIEKIKIRNNDRVTLTRPKGLSIANTVALIQCHLMQGYRQFGPRLPQIAIYAVYRCLIVDVGRYSGCELEPLGRMKSADRKADTIGDVVVLKNGLPIEAVEIKHGRVISLVDVAEAIDKVRTLSVRRYYMLSTAGANEEERESLQKRQEEFRRQNGCEIIVNGVIESLAYYLRLLPDTNQFISNYTEIVEADSDTAYEHRTAWNSCCERISN